MREDPIRRALATLSGPVAPSREFADTLFKRLLGEAKRRPPILPPRAPRRRLSPQTRRILTIAAALLLALVAIAFLVAPFRDYLRGNRQPLGPIDSSTPFRATIEGRFENPGNVLGCCWTEDPGGTFRFRLDYKSPDAWRIDLLGGTELRLPFVNENIGSPGDFTIWDGKTLRSYDSSKNLYYEDLHAPGFSPLDVLGYLNPASGWQDACSTGEQLADEVLLGRPVHHYSCPTNGSFGDRVDLWVDMDSGLILRISSHLPTPVGQPTPVPGPFTFFPGETLEMNALEYDAAFAAGDFTFTPPAGAESYTQTQRQTPPTSLAVGDVAPTWRGHSLDGVAFDLAGLRGKPTVVYLWADWCPPCTGVPLDVLDDAFRNRTDVNVVTVGWQADEKSLMSFVRQRAYGFPVVLPDDANAVSKQWGIQAIPTLVLLDADGRFAGAYSGFNREIGTKADVEAVIDAFLSGRPLPHDPVFSSEQLG